MVYADMGEFALKDYYRLKALDFAKRYFIRGVPLKYSHRWGEYQRALLLRMGDVAQQKKQKKFSCFGTY